MLDKKNILVVNDKRGMREILAEILKDAGYNVSMAEDGYEAIEKVRKLFFAIIFLDMRMPGIGGVETLREIKKISPETRVVMITAYVDKDSEKEAMREGADTVIYKPFGVKETMAIIEKLDDWV